MSEKNNLYMVKAMYLGSEPMGELLDGENGSDAIQVPLKRTILRTENAGDEVELSMTNDSLVVTFVHKRSQKNRLVLPIDLLAYCGALRQLPSDKIKEREFETLDKSPPLNSNDPPLFVTIFRNFEMENTLFCHSFIIRRDDEAMELVKLVMEIYYNLIRLQELDETSFNNDQNENVMEMKDLTNKGKMVDKVQAHDEDRQRNSSISDYNDLLNIYNKMSVSESKDSIKKTQTKTKTPTKLADNNNNTSNYSSPEDIYNLSTNENYEIVSANDLLNNEYSDQLRKSNHMLDNNENDKEVDNDYGGHEDINVDPNPIVIRRKNEENIEYKQNVFIRWLQPPTPPPPAPIIIREIQEEEAEEPPLIIYKQAPRAETPPPLVIRERPPSPLDQPTEPFIIEKRVPAKYREQQQRKIIIEHLPAPPPKPRDIILEKWLPKNVPIERTVYYQKLNNNNPTNTCQYDSIQQKQLPTTSYNNNNKQPNNTNNNMKQIGDIPAKRATSNLYNQHNNNSELHECQMNNRDIYYPSSSYSSKKSQKLAGYRIIRQIIPGPNSTAAEIEKALARSQYVSTSFNQQNNSQSRIYSPSFNDRASFQHSQIYSGSNCDVYSNNSPMQKGMAYPGQYQALNKSYSSHQDINLSASKSNIYKRLDYADKM